MIRILTARDAPKFSKNASIVRVETRAQVSGKVISVDKQVDDFVYLISYDEGGQGYWPEWAIR